MHRAHFTENSVRQHQSKSDRKNQQTNKQTTSKSTKQQNDYKNRKNYPTYFMLISVQFNSTHVDSDDDIDDNKRTSQRREGQDPVIGTMRRHNTPIRGTSYPH